MPPTSGDCESVKRLSDERRKSPASYDVEIGDSEGINRRIPAIYLLYPSRVRLPSTRIEVMSEEVATLMRTKTGAERLEIASKLFSSARKMLIAFLRAQHPDWDDHQIEREASHRLSHGAI